MVSVAPSSGFTSVFDVLCSPPRLGGLLSHNTTNIRELEDRAGSSKQTEVARLQQTKARPGTRQEDEATIREAEDRIIQVARKLRLLGMQGGLTQPHRQTQAADAFEALEPLLEQSWRYVLTLYASGGLFYMLRVLRQLPIGREARGSGTVSEDTAELRRLLDVGFRTLRLTAQAGSTGDVVDMIRNYGVLDMTGHSMTTFPADCGLHGSALELLLLLLERAHGHELQREVEGGGLPQILATSITAYTNTLASERDPLLLRALLLSLEACRGLANNKKQGGRISLALASHHDWEPLAALVSLTQVATITIGGNQQEDCATVGDVEAAACSLLLCMVAQSTLVANKLTCMGSVRVVTAAVRRHSDDREVLRWLKGALLSFDSCKVRGKLLDKPQTVTAILNEDKKTATLKTHLRRFSCPATTTWAKSSPRHINLSASEFAREAVKDYRLKKLWLAQIDDYVALHGANKEHRITDTRSPEATQSRNQGRSAWTPHGLSPYALPVVAGLTPRTSSSSGNRKRPRSVPSSALRPTAVTTKSGHQREMTRPSTASHTRREEGEDIQHAVSSSGGRKVKRASSGQVKRIAPSADNEVHVQSGASNGHADAQSQASASKGAKQEGVARGSQSTGAKKKEQRQFRKQLSAAAQTNMLKVTQRLLGPLAAEARTPKRHYTSKIDRLSYNERLQVLLLSVEQSLKGKKQKPTRHDNRSRSQVLQGQTNQGLAAAQGDPTTDLCAQARGVETTTEHDHTTSTSCLESKKVADSCEEPDIEWKGTSRRAVDNDVMAPLDKEQDDTQLIGPASGLADVSSQHSGHSRAYDVYSDDGFMSTETLDGTVQLNFGSC